MSSSGARKRSRAPSEGPAKRVMVQKAADLEVVMVKCRALKDELRKKASIEVDADPDEIPSGIVEVAELSSSEVLEGIEGVALTITNQVLARQGFSMDIPSRASSVSLRCQSLESSSAA